MRFQVPQFVDIEDKVIGPLTLKQFGFYMIGVMIVAIFYALFDIGLLIVLAIPTFGLMVLFAHARFAGQSFSTVLVHGLWFYTGEKLYLWRRLEKISPLIVSGSEYVDSYDDYEASSLVLINQALNTEGNIVDADAADPLLDTEVTK